MERREVRDRRNWNFGFLKQNIHEALTPSGAQLIFKRSSFKIEEKQETTNICCNLRGYFLFHVVTMLNNNSTNKGFRYHVSLKVLSDMFGVVGKLWVEDYLLLKTFIYVTTFFVWCWICFPSSQKKEKPNWKIDYYPTENSFNRVFLL